MQVEIVKLEMEVEVVKLKMERRLAFDSSQGFAIKTLGIALRPVNRSLPPPHLTPTTQVGRAARWAR
jgi:hypothetical protein